MDAFKSPQLLEGFFIHDVTTVGDPSYTGYVNPRGAWYIVEYNLASGTYRYARGLSDYSTSWTGRAGLSYDYLNVVFAT